MEVLTLGQAQRGPCTALLHKGRDAPAPLRIPRSFFYFPTSPHTVHGGRVPWSGLVWYYSQPQLKEPGSLKAPCRLGTGQRTSAARDSPFRAKQSPS